MTTPRSRAVSEMATRVPSTRTSWQLTLSTSWLEPSHNSCVFAAFSRSLHALSQALMSATHAANLLTDDEARSTDWAGTSVTGVSHQDMPSVLWHCWLGGRKGIRPVKNWVVGCWHGYLSWYRWVDLHMAQLMPLPLTVSCFSKIQIGFTFLVPAHPGSPGQRAAKRVCVCVCRQSPGYRLMIVFWCTVGLPIWDEI